MKYLRTGFVLLMLAVIVLASSACITKSPTQEIADENSANNSSNETPRFTETNDTDNTSVNPVSIPLEKPPFID
jgi:hypothetical protein